MSELHIQEGRHEDFPIFIHSDLDDFDLTVNAFRVYAHLSRRAGRDNDAWPSYNSIGLKCFRQTYPKAKEETLQRHARTAVKELVDKGLIYKQVNKREDGSHGSNTYRLTPRREWKGGGGNALQGATPPRGHNPTGGNTPKGTPYKGTPYEDTPPSRTRKRSAKEAHPNTKPILEAYAESLGYEPPNYKKEAAAAKILATKGYEPVDIVAAYQRLKSQTFWEDKHLPLNKLIEEIPAMQQALLKGVPGKSNNGGVSAILDYALSKEMFSERN